MRPACLHVIYMASHHQEARARFMKCLSCFSKNLSMYRTNKLKPHRASRSKSLDEYPAHRSYENRSWFLRFILFAIYLLGSNVAVHIENGSFCWDRSEVPILRK